MAKTKQSWSNYENLLKMRQLIQENPEEAKKVELPLHVIVSMVNIIEASFNLLVNPIPGQHYNLVHKALAEIKRFENG